MSKKAPIAIKSETRAAVLTLLQHVAESEHQLRHPAAFAELCAAHHFAVGHDGVRVIVTDLLAPPVKPEAKPEAETK